MLRLFVLSLILTVSNVVIADVLLESKLDTPKMVGSGEYRAMFWKVYEAELYSNDGEFVLSNPFALKLIYSRKINGEAITDKSIELIRRQGEEDEILLAAWHRQLNDIFPNVKQGTEIVGVHEAGLGASFYVDGNFVGTITDPDLCGKFFGIWLDENTIAPKLRSDLLGLTE